MGQHAVPQAIRPAKGVDEGVKLCRRVCLVDGLTARTGAFDRINANRVRRNEEVPLYMDVLHRIASSIVERPAL